MNKIKFLEIDGRFGIELNGEEIVPICHPTKESACEEWEYFEELNRGVSRPFLDIVRTQEDVNKLKAELWKK